MQAIEPLLRDRLFEWVSACALLMLGMMCALYPEVIGASNWRYILLIISSSALSSFLLAVGVMRVAALIANGRYWPAVSPWLRGLGAVCGALLWFQFAYALWIYTSGMGRMPSPGIPVYLSLMVGEMISAYRAVAGRRHGP